MSYLNILFMATLLIAFYFLSKKLARDILKLSGEVEDISKSQNALKEFQERIIEQLHPLESLDWNEFKQRLQSNITQVDEQVKQLALAIERMQQKIDQIFSKVEGEIEKEQGSHQRNSLCLTEIQEFLKKLDFHLGTIENKFPEMQQLLKKSLCEDWLSLREFIREMKEKIEIIENHFLVAIDKMLERLSSLQNTSNEINTHVLQWENSRSILLSLQEKILEQEKALQITGENVANILPPLDTIYQEVKSWESSPLARCRDIEKRKIAVLIDFENAFISLWRMGAEIFDYKAFKKFLTDPFGTNDPISEKIILVTNKSRWRRKDYYDRNNEITQEYAKKVKNSLKQQGFRVIEPDSNVDIPLTLLAIAMAEKSDIEEFILVANDGTYAGLVSKLSDMGCAVSGIMIGEDASGDLISCYKELGFKKFHLRSEKDFEKIGLFKRKCGNISSYEENSAKEQQQAEEQEQDSVMEIPVAISTREKINKIAKKTCFTPSRKQRENYLQFIFHILAIPHLPKEVRNKVKQEFPETNVACRLTLEKILIKSGNIKIKEDNGIWERTVDSIETWLSKAEEAWIQTMIGLLQRIEPKENDLPEILTPEFVLGEVMEYEASSPEYEKFKSLFAFDIPKKENAFYVSKEIVESSPTEKNDDVEKKQSDHENVEKSSEIIHSIIDEDLFSDD